MPAAALVHSCFEACLEFPLLLDVKLSAESPLLPCVVYCSVYDVLAAVPAAPAPVPAPGKRLGSEIDDLFKNVGKIKQQRAEEAARKEEEARVCALLYGR